MSTRSKSTPSLELGILFVLEITRKQARFEAPKFNKKCNCIEMTRKEITWVESVTNYYHIIIICSKLIPNFKVSKCIQKLDRKK
jgi:hypothetical protein